MRRLAQLVREALQDFDLTPSRTRLVMHGENTTFDVRATRGSRKWRVAARVHREGYQSAARIRSEHAWTEALYKDAGLLVPQQLRTRSGDSVVHSATDDIAEGRLVSVAEWIPGRLPSRVGATTWAKLGRVMATMNQHASSWNPPSNFDRLTLDAVGLSEGIPQVGTIDRVRNIGQAHVPGVSEHVPELLDGVHELGEWARPRMMEAERHDGLMIVHGDLHFANVMHFEGRLAVLDFDDTMFSHRLVDLAVPLGAAKPASRDVFVRAYRSRYQLDERDLELVPAYVSGRLITEVLWLVERATEIPMLRRYIPRVGERLAAQVGRVRDDDLDWRTFGLIDR